MQRERFLKQIQQAFEHAPVVALLGPRQCGKTTLARQYFKENQGTPSQYYDCEYAPDQIRLQEPTLALEHAEGLIVIDEIQRQPNLFPLLRVLVDQISPQQRYLILGSASKDLIQQSSESLAGRIHYIELTPFAYHEFDDVNEIQKLWLRGGFPRSYLAKNTAESMQWRLNYIRTFLEQDIPNLGLTIPAENLRRFWLMLAHYHGQVANASALGNALDLSHNTIRRYIDLLTGTFMVRQLPPWHENLKKRQVKSNKIYFKDSGLYHALLNISDQEHLYTTPQIGASWEGFALESLIRHLGLEEHECYFWATHTQTELDLLVIRGLQRWGFEFKFSKTPKLTKVMQTVMDDLKLSRLVVIYPGEHPIRLSKEVTCIGLESFLNTPPEHWLT